MVYWTIEDTYSVKKVTFIAPILPLNSSCLYLSKMNQSAYDPLLCRFFVSDGYCRFGNGCRYSHDLGGKSREEALKTIPCPFFLKGVCRHGGKCRFLHGNMVPVKRSSNVDNNGRLESEDSVTDPPNPEPEEATCGICLDDVRSQQGRQFGLLSCCNHVFCYSCVMSWRTEGSKEAQNRRVCPTCRKQSDYVVPSPRLASSQDEKDQIVSDYKGRLAAIPCKRFNGELGSCYFGKDCFYAHLDSDGIDVKSQDDSMQELYERRRSKRHRRYRGRVVDPAEELADMLLLLHLLRSRAETDDDSLALALLSEMVEIGI